MVKTLNRLKRYVQKKLGISQLIAENKVLLEKQFHLIACQQETLKANLFRDTIQDSEWLRYKSFSPGGWAVDYGVLYTLFRVLNDMKPKNIIEFGLGQSSRLLHQYGAYYKNVKVVTCEHSFEWIDFFKAEINDKYPIDINLLGLENRNYNGVETLVYKGLADACKGEKYDMIMVDGPYGSDRYSRSQLIDLVQENLAERFCIIMDDYGRSGEQETVEEVMKVLDEKQSPYLRAVYESSKQHCLICSKDLGFLTTLCWF